jgi:ubiquinone/menaquinone biosynthesis C-methylase UbiE
MAGREERGSAPGTEPLLDSSRIGRWYDDTAEAYEEVVWRNRQGAHRLVWSLPDGEYRDLLDVGCGTGLASAAMAERFPLRSITGVDLSPEMLKRFRARLEALLGIEVRAHEADVAAMPVPDGAFDVAISTMAFHWFADQPGAVAAMARALRPGGVFGLLMGGEGTEEEYRQILIAIRSEVPRQFLDVYALQAGRLARIERWLRDAGLEPLDVWMEQRRREGPPERFIGRMRAVAGHLIADLPQEEQDDAWARVLAAVSDASGSGGFVYHFNKAFAVARKPGAGADRVRHHVESARAPA